MDTALFAPQSRVAHRLLQAMFLVVSLIAVSLITLKAYPAEACPTVIGSTTGPGYTYYTLSDGTGIWAKDLTQGTPVCLR